MNYDNDSKVCGQALSPQKVPEIAYQLDDASCALSRVHDAIDKLYCRLQSVTFNPPQCVGNERGGFAYQDRTW